jgi:hypothetical protein
MKIYLSLALSAILMTTTANAQHVNVGVKGGLNIYNIKNSSSLEYDSKVGLHLGLLGHIHLAPQFAIQPEIVYSVQGAKYSVANVETKLNLNYINVPVMFQYMFQNGFRLEAGPQVGFLISAKSEVNNNSSDIKTNLKTVDFGLGIGAGYIQTSSGFGVDARYNIGLNSIYETGSVKSTNRGFQLGVFYQFKRK